MALVDGSFARLSKMVIERLLGGKGEEADLAPVLISLSWAVGTMSLHASISPSKILLIRSSLKIGTFERA